MSGSAINPVNWITPYKVDVIQGNFISSEQVGQLQPGMSRDQVKAVLGTPLLTSLFHTDRWDYVFTLKRQGVAPQSFKYTVFFKGDQLERFEGDTMPSEEEFVALVDTRVGKSPKIPQLEASESQLDKFKPDDKKGGKSADAPAAPLAPLPPSYPPLETAR